MSDSFFDQSYVYQALWSLLVGVTCFLLGVGWNVFQGPDKVVVTEQRGMDSLSINIDGDSLSSLSKEGVRSVVEKEISRLQGVISESGKEVNPDPNKIAKNVNSLHSPPFEMPAVVEGYSTKSLNPLAKAECPPSTVERADIITLDMLVLNESIMNKTTPIFLNIYEIRDDEPKILRMKEEYQFKSLRNTLLFIASFSEGDYELKYGFYLKEKLDQKYPPFRSKTCHFSVES